MRFFGEIMQKSITKLPTSTVDNLRPEEKELVFNMDATSRTKIMVFCDDPYWIKRLDKIAQASNVAKSGSKTYSITTKDLLILFKDKDAKQESLT